MHEFFKFHLKFFIYKNMPSWFILHLFFLTKNIIIYSYTFFTIKNPKDLLESITFYLKINIFFSIFV
jgi:hypothetical protein